MYDLASAQMRQLTDDAFADLQPAWSPDGTRLLFVTDRFTSDPDALTFGDMGLAVMDIADGRITPIRTGLQRSGIEPAVDAGWHRRGVRLGCLRASGRLSGQHDGRRGRPGRHGTDRNLGHHPDEPGTFGGSGFRCHGGHRLPQWSVPKFAGWTPNVDPHRQSADLALLPPASRTSGEVARLLDRRAPVVSPQGFDTRSYRSSLSLVGIGQQIGASTGGTFGTYVSGGVSMLFSDVLGNHLVPVTVGVEGGVKDLAAQSGYINRTSRWNWGVMASHVPLRSGYVDTGFDVVDGTPVYVERTQLLRETTSELGGLLAYPFSRATRLEFTASARRIGFGREQITSYFDPGTGQFLGEQTEDIGGAPSLQLADTSVALVRDQSAYGAVSPVLGQRFRFEVTPTFGDLRMTTATLDFRQYVMPVRPLTLAMRALHVGRYGASGEDSRLFPLFLGYPTLVRGYDAGSFQSSECTVTADGSCPEFDRLRGSRLLVFNGEARVPLFGLFTGRLDYGPLPAEIFGFFDAGVAWNSVERPVFADGTRPWVSSAGFGARVNLFGYAVGEFNLARAIDRPERGWQFVFNLQPGF